MIVSNLESLARVPVVHDDLVDSLKLLHAEVVFFTSSIGLAMLSNELHEGVFNVWNDGSRGSS